MDNDALLAWANAQFKIFDGVNADKQERMALIMATAMQTRVLNGLSLQIQKALAAKHDV